MHQKIRMIAAHLAVVLFFTTAIVGWLCGCSPSVCAVRSAGSALVMYAAVSIAGRLILRILLEAIVDSQMRKHTAKDESL